MEEIKILAQKAIQSALSGEWPKAVELNQEILKKDSKNIEALNRLTKAYLELGKKKKARATIKKVLNLDEFNPIAIKNLKKINEFFAGKKTDKTTTDPDLFIEEPGKTKTVQLINLADKSILSKLAIGEKVNLVPRKRRISVVSQSGTYLGKLPDDISHKLGSFIKGGNQYQTYIRSTSDGVKVFIREVSRAKKFANSPTFVSSDTSYQSFTPPDLIHESPPDVLSEEETEE